MALLLLLFPELRNALLWLAGGIGLAILLIAPLLGLFIQPWSPWWVVKPGTSTITPPIGGGPAPIPIEPGPAPGHVTDPERYALARAAGWSFSDAVTATAISFAENGSGDPAALSGRNFNGSYDLGLMQINSAWWPRFGGHDALIVPINNFRAAHTIYEIQNWCAWSTYLASCGPGHTGSYASFITRALAAQIKCNCS